MKRIVFAMLVAVLVTACGQAQTPVVKEVLVPGPTQIVEKVVPGPTQIVTKEILTERVTIEWMTEEASCPKGIDFVGPACAAWWAKQYEKDHPNIKVNVTVVAPLDGTTGQIDAYLLAGLQPNILTGYGGRLSSYRQFAFGLPYDPAKWQHPAIDGWVQDGKLTMYPLYAWCVTTQVNYSYAEELGVLDLLPELDGERTWTIEQFVKLAEALKAKGVKTSLAYASNTSGDYGMDMWGLAFGGQLYQDGDFTKLAVNSPEWVNAWKFLKGMVDGRYFVADPWALTDDDYNAAMMSRGVLVISASSLGTNTKGDQMRLVSYPSVDGTFIPFATAPSGILVFDNVKRMKEIGKFNEAQIAKAQASQNAAVAFSQWLSEGPFVKELLRTRGWTWRTDLESAAPQALDTDPATLRKNLQTDFEWMQAMVAKYGLSDCGTGSPFYQILRKVKVKHLGLMFQGKETPEGALAATVAEFQAAAK